MKTRSTVMLVVGVLFSMMGLGLVLGSIGASWVNAAQSDDGFLSSPRERFSVDSVAITSARPEGMRDEAVPGPLPFDVGKIRIRAESANADKEIFVGIAPRSEVERYLAGSNYSELLEVNFRPFRTEYQEVPGSTQPAPPAQQGFWVASASGAGGQEIDWNIQPGNWSVVVMNADASPGLAVDLQAGFRSELLGPVAAGLLIAGAALLIIGIPLLIIGATGLGRHTGIPSAGPVARMTPAARTQGPGLPGQGLPGPWPDSGTHPVIAATPSGAGAAPIRFGYELHAAETGPYPARLVGELDPVLSTWKWLVKWFLAIPHFILLFFLWFAFAVVTIIAGFSILFTGRYPRSLFDFNVGVLRWNWRVAFYAYAVLGTDRYPPFTLARTDYPADFDVEYPERLSRGLVLVKWWLLAIPHLLIIAAFTGSSTIRWNDPENPGVRYETGSGLSLLGLLVIIAAVILLFTGRYLRSLFDFVLGINRWIYRVITYAALMRDEYPPFRLDQGPREPGERGARDDDARTNRKQPPP